MEASAFFSIIGFLVIVRWMYTLKKNSNEQVRQNNEIIALLKQNEK